jgi:hypothetical protein
MSISLQTFESYIRCKYKGYLKLNGQIGIKSDFEIFDEERVAQQKNRYYQKIDSANNSKVQLERKIITKEILSSGFDYLFNGSAISDNTKIEIDCTENSKRNHYQVIIHIKQF